MPAPIRLSSFVRATAKAQSSVFWIKPTRTTLQRNLVISARPLNLTGQLETTNKRTFAFSPSSSLSVVSHPALLFLRPYHVSIHALEQRRASDSTVDHIHNHDSEDKDTTKAQPAIDDDIQHQHKNPMPPNLDPKARLLIGFTCTVCNHRSHKTMSKHAYQHGVVIMQCDGCKNRHLIADNLGWFKNGGVNVEDLVKEKGETVKKLSRDYQLIKDGSTAGVDGTTSKDASIDPSLSSGGGESREKTETELALEKASEGMLEWVPKEILQFEEEKMQKARELVKDTPPLVEKKE
ncbi:hypothetical protein BGZ83_011851 [Gryganskiella cystojenkinii]|nr:hypothetical protein BGZ83_011851 [Gryganskiella cystojenkinii]